MSDSVTSEVIDTEAPEAGETNETPTVVVTELAPAAADEPKVSAQTLAEMEAGRQALAVNQAALSARPADNTEE